MARNLTKKQREFANEYLESGNATKAALKAYDTDKPNTAKAIGSENLTKPNVIEYLDQHSINAAQNIIDLANNAENEAVKLNANKDILDRSGYKPIEKHAVAHFDGELQERERELGSRLLQQQRTA